ncbi:MAG: acetyltransferase [Pseudomonadota bacterium]
MKIRSVIDADRPRLFEVWQAAVHATHDFLSPDDLAGITDMVRTAYFPAAFLTVAVDHNDVALGFIDVEDGTAINALFVDPACHGQGVGRALVDAAMPKGVPLTVEVNEQNHAARAVYEHWGFRTIDRKPIDGEGRPYPLLVMRRD